MSTAVRTAVAAAEPPRGPLTAGDLTVGQDVWVVVDGRWYRGEVTCLAQVRVRVAYPTTDHLVRERWFAATDAEPVLHGGLAAPVRYRCVGVRCRVLCTGRPGQSSAEIRAAHERSAEHHGDLR